MSSSVKQVNRDEGRAGISMSTFKPIESDLRTPVAFRKVCIIFKAAILKQNIPGTTK
jgi:hypothetical protein